MVLDGIPVHAAGALLVFGSVLATSLGLPVPVLRRCCLTCVRRRR